MLTHRENLYSATLLIIAVAAAACDGTSSSPGKHSSLVSLRGQIVNWNNGAGYSVTMSVRPRGATMNTPVLKTPIAASGEFSLTLPDDATMAQLSTPQPIQPFPQCSGELVAEPNDARLVYLSLADDGTDLVGYPELHKELLNTIPFSTGASAGYVYADREVTISGSEACKITASRFGITTYDVHYLKGWNQQIYSYKRDETATTLGTLPDGYAWARSYKPY